MEPTFASGLRLIAEEKSRSIIQIAWEKPAWKKITERLVYASHRGRLSIKISVSDQSDLLDDIVITLQDLNIPPITNPNEMITVAELFEFGGMTTNPLPTGELLVKF